jgi:DNA repair photolyase
MAPLLPGITTSRASIEETMRAARDHGAAFVGANVLRLDGGTREHFLRVLAAEYPDLSEGYGRLFADGARQVPRDYARAVDKVVADVRAMLELRERPSGQMS